MSASDMTVLIPGHIHPQVVTRLEKDCTLIRIDKADAGLLAKDDVPRIRAIACSTTVDASLISALPNLEIIANFGVGYDKVDADSAAAQGVMVTNTPDVLNEEVADTAVGLLLNTVREFPRAEQWLREGRWSKQGPYRLTPTTLRDRSIGIFGLGRIGLAIARRLEAFGLPISYHNRSKVEGVSYRYFDSLTDLARNVDTLVSVAPGTPQTEKAVNAEVLEALGPQGVFVNIGRGSTVDEPALIAALGNGTIKAAGLDVFADEPHVPDALLALDNTSLLPHVGSASEHTRIAMADLVSDNILSWFSGSKAITPVAETVHLQKR